MPDKKEGICPECKHPNGFYAPRWLCDECWARLESNYRREAGEWRVYRDAK